MIVAPINRIQHLVTEHLAPGIDVYGDPVLAALALLHRLTNSFDTAVVFKAAMAILNLEKTRLRHKQPVTGMKVPEEAANEPYDHEQELIDTMRCKRGNEPSEKIESEQEALIELTTEQEVQFEQMVDEGIVYLNEKRDAKREPTVSHNQRSMVYMRSIEQQGFDEMKSGHRKMVERYKATKSATSRDVQLRKSQHAEFDRQARGNACEQILWATIHLGGLLLGRSLALPRKSGYTLGATRLSGVWSLVNPARNGCGYNTPSTQAADVPESVGTPTLNRMTFCEVGCSQLTKKRRRDSPPAF